MTRLSRAGKWAILGALLLTACASSLPPPLPPPPPAIPPMPPTTPPPPVEQPPLSMVPPRQIDAMAMVRPAPPTCAARELAPFPTEWPAPTVSVELPVSAFTGTASGIASVSDMSKRLEASLRAAGYPRPRYLGYACNGLAVAANFEAIRTDGRRVAGAGGFPASSEEAAAAEGAVDFLVGLFYARPGFHRRIVFVVTDEEGGSSGRILSETEIFAMVEAGSARVPDAYSRVRLTAQHTVTALIYEFELRPGAQSARLIRPAGTPPKGLLDGCTHLKAAGLLRACRP